jgi:flagellar hook-associated protein 3 FlgL
VQGATDNAAGGAREAIAEEIRGIIDTVKTAANASYGGRYVLAGTTTDVPPFRVGADDAYYGDEERIGRQIGPGVTIDVNIHGREAIGDDDEGLLSVLRGVVQHLTDDDGPALRSDLLAMNTSLDQLTAVRATVGATQNRLEVAAGRLAEYEGTTLALLSQTEDADFAKTMIDFSVQKAALEAGLKAGANIVQTSLLDFLR